MYSKMEIDLIAKTLEKLGVLVIDEDIIKVDKKSVMINDKKITWNEFKEYLACK